MERPVLYDPHRDYQRYQHPYHAAQRSYCPRRGVNVHAVIPLVQKRGKHRSLASRYEFDGKYDYRIDDGTQEIKDPCQDRNQKRLIPLVSLELHRVKDIEGYHVRYIRNIDIVWHVRVVWHVCVVGHIRHFSVPLLKSR